MKTKKIWNQEINSEVSFWQQYIATQGDLWKDEYQARLNPELEIQDNIVLQILSEIPETSISILDVGAGPLTILGKRYPGKEIKITAVDPLAEEYDKLLETYKIVPPVRTILCHGEELLNEFQPETYDLAYARNAIDHSYNPLLIIQNMLALVKKNRFIVLRHEINEGEKANYKGLHQWNFTEKDNDFIIWNKENEYNVTKILSNQAQVACLSDGVWIACKIQKLAS